MLARLPRATVFDFGLALEAGVPAFAFSDVLRGLPAVVAVRLGPLLAISFLPKSSDVLAYLREFLVT